ncbi:ATP-binding protein [Hymenobacter defluvii]|uniref:histidine kinase n=1 Tax=Hymenobacter defluvii TaxID=2054411 RepID=A0ABS3T6U9_9BACT|nr:ATP-binding protein [Hymenobacter defluvii]MBO3269373.1 GAF domain-containing protein [Hymenobacter defluvii]
MSADILFTGGGEMGERIRTLDWSQTKLGPVADWPQSLISAVQIMLGSRFPMMVHWGPELIHFYNDGYASILQGKHPGALGQPAQAWWSEMWPFLTPIFDQVWAGNTTHFENQLVLPNRQGFVEETYFTFSHSPIRNESGQVAGIFVTAIETTTTVLNQRRLAMFSSLMAHAALATKPVEAAQHLVASLATDSQDIPFALLYSIDQPAQLAHLTGWFGLPAGEPTAPSTIPLSSDRYWPMAEALYSRQPVLVADLAARFGSWPEGEWAVDPRQALMLPLRLHEADQIVDKILVVGLSARRPLNADYQGFFSLVADYAGRALNHAAATYEAYRLNQALQEANNSLDTFVHIAAHDLKGPVNNLHSLLEVYHEEPAGTAQEHVMSLLSKEVHRLTSTVSGLLEILRSQHTVAPPAEKVELQTIFSRVYTDLVGYIQAQDGVITADFSRAPVVVCPPAYLESILKNLLHNALKYRAPDRPPVVHLSSRSRDNTVVLTITDNGIGIDLTRDKERLFSPFTRLTAEGEGAGLGLYMVRSLVQQQGGMLDASSTPGVGTTFTVVLPATRVND